MKKIKDFKNGDFIYLLNVNKDPMVILDGIIETVFVNGNGISSIYNAKFKVILPDGTNKWFYANVPNVSLGKYHLYDIEYPNLDYDKGVEYFISTDRNYLIDEYIKNSNLAILLWEDNVKKYQELVDTEKERIEYLKKQRHD